jgi:hypothetical protein
LCFKSSRLLQFRTDNAGSIGRGDGPNLEFFEPLPFGRAVAGARSMTGLVSSLKELFFLIFGFESSWESRDSAIELRLVDLPLLIEPVESRC